jgi:hypothetical protein
MGTVGMDDALRAEWQRRTEVESEKLAMARETSERAMWKRLNQKFGEK